MSTPSISVNDNYGNLAGNKIKQIVNGTTTLSVGDSVGGDKAAGNINRGTFVKTVLTSIGENAPTLLPPIAAATLGFITPGIYARFSGGIAIQENENYLSQASKIVVYSWEHRQVSVLTATGFGVLCWLVTRRS